MAYSCPFLYNIAMNLNLTRPLAFFDLETTGVDVTKDKIVQIATVKINIDGTKESKCYIINPTIPIPTGASDVHGITDDIVQDKPDYYRPQFLYILH